MYLLVYFASIIVSAEVAEDDNGDKVNNSNKGIIVVSEAVKGFNGSKYSKDKAVEAGIDIDLILNKVFIVEAEVD